MADIVARLQDERERRLFGDALMNRAAAEIARLRAALAWQPIESAPRDGSFLIANALGEVCPCQSRDGHRIASNMPGHADWTWRERATHWLPLPPPPAQEDLADG